LQEVESFLLRHAAFTTTTSSVLAAALHARYGGRRPDVLTNSFSSAAPVRTPDESAVPTFFWFSQTLGPGRGLEEFVAGWTRTHQPSRLVLLGASAGSFARDLRERVPLSRRGQLEIVAPVPPHELPALIARHDIGLALEQSAIPNRDLTITNKILQYLVGGLAVLATPTRGQREVLGAIPEAGEYVSLSEPAALGVQLDRLLADRTRLSTYQEAARRLAGARFCWELEAPRLVTRVEATLGLAAGAQLP
jgi:glycosyltransferase involved in cell wall biosynthesis